MLSLWSDAELGLATEEPEPFSLWPDRELVIWVEPFSLWTEGELESEDPEPLTAAFPFMSKAQRAAKVARQWRDRAGKWRDMPNIHIPLKPSESRGGGDEGAPAVAKEPRPAMEPPEVAVQREKMKAEAAEAAKTKALSPEPEGGFKKKFNEVRAKVPKGKDFGRMTKEQKYAIAEEAQKRLDALNKAEDEVWTARWEHDDPAQRHAALRTAAEKIVGPIDQNATQEEIMALVQKKTMQLRPELGNAIHDRNKTRVDVVDNTLGPTAQEHMDNIAEAAKLLGDELDRRIAASMDLDPEKMQAQAAVLEEEYNRLDAEYDAAKKEADDTYDAYDADPTPEKAAVADEADEKAKRIEKQRDDVDNEWTDLLELLKSPRSSDKYKKAMRDETVKLLSEIRPMGGWQKYNVPSAGIHGYTPEEVREIMDQIGGFYPTDWHDLLAQTLGRQGIKLIESPTGRGYNQGGNLIAMSNKTPILSEDTALHDVASHELGHSMEHVVEGLGVIQYLTSLQRSPREQEQPKVIADDPKKHGKEIVYADKWALEYSGKVYGKGNEKEHWEMFTVAMQSLFHGHSGFIRSARQQDYDDDYRNLMLAILGLL